MLQNWCILFSPRVYYIFNLLKCYLQTNGVSHPVYEKIKTNSHDIILIEITTGTAINFKQVRNGNNISIKYVSGADDKD